MCVYVGSHCRLHRLGAYRISSRADDAGGEVLKDLGFKGDFE